MRYNLSVTTHYGDSPENPNYRTIIERDVHTDNPAPLMTDAAAIVDAFMQRMDDLDTLESTMVKAKLFGDVLDAIIRGRDDIDGASLRREHIDSYCTVTTIRVYPDTFFDLDTLSPDEHGIAC